MKKSILSAIALFVLSAVLLVFPNEAAAADVQDMPYTPSTQLEARCVPTFVPIELNGETDWHLLYNPETAAMMLDLTDAATLLGKSDGWKDIMASYGYGQLQHTYDNKTYSEEKYPWGTIVIEGSETTVFFPAINALVGMQEVEYNGQTRYAIAIVFRGSSDAVDWHADFTAIPDSEWFHMGFSRNSADFYSRMCDELSFTVEGETLTLTQIFDEMKTPDSKFNLLVMGHSLGGALSDVFVGRDLYRHGVHPSNVACYTIAAAKSAPYGYEYPYHNIINIVNADDLVPQATLINNQRIGEDYTYCPDDDFRREYYGLAADFAAGEDHLFWQSTGFLLSVGAPHRLNDTYRGIVADISAEIAASAEDEEEHSIYTNYSTCGYNIWAIGDAIVSPNTFGSFTNSVRVGSALKFAGGVMQVDGTCDLPGGLIMQGTDDYLLAGGDLNISGYCPTDEFHLTAGTVEVRGDFFANCAGGYCYRATGEHRTVFSGTGKQTAVTRVDEDFRYANLYLRNENVCFQTAVGNMSLAEDASVIATDALVVSYELDLNGYKLEQSGDMEVGELLLRGGELAVSGNLKLHGAGAVNGVISTGGNLECVETLVFSEGRVWVTGNCYLPATLIMQNESDYLTVCGMLTVFARDWDEISDDHLSAGTVDLKGDMEFEGGSICQVNGYRESGTHKTVLSGTDHQTIYFNWAGEPNCFENLCIRNPLTSLYMVNDVRLGESAKLIVSGDDSVRRIVINGTLDLNGNAVTVDASDWTNPDYPPVSIGALDFSNGGDVTVIGDMLLRSGMLNGTLNVTGDLEVEDMFTFAGGQATVGGDCTVDKSLVMRDDADYLLVGGDLTLTPHADVTKDHLSAGTVELKGDLIMSNDENYCYYACGDHRTIFSGDGVQTVNMGAAHENRVLQACLRNPNVVLEMVHTLRLMEDGALNDAGKSNIHGTLDLNGYRLASRGEFKTLNDVADDTGVVLQVDTDAEKQTVTVKTAYGKGDPIRVLFTGYAADGRLLICEVMEFSSAQKMKATLKLSNWPECAAIHTFLLEDDYTPFCAALDMAQLTVTAPAS